MFFCLNNTGEIPGESRLLGKGVSYCATCDGELYRGKRIAVICTDPLRRQSRQQSRRCHAGAQAEDALRRQRFTAADDAHGPVRSQNL